MERRRVVLVGCGGTIAASTTSRSFISTADLLSMYGLWDEVAAIAVVTPLDFDSRSSTEVTPSDALALAIELGRLDSDPNVDGVVVTYGTGTLEETVFLAHLTVRPRTRVVFTAAMTPHGARASDGAANLFDAVLVAISNLEPGVYVAVHGEIHDPREVMKVDASSARPFGSIAVGPLGRIEDGTVRRFRHPVGHDVLSVDKLTARVELIKCYQGMDGNLIQHLPYAAIQGLVVETLASGQVTPALAPELVRLAKSGVCVALSTRCPTGRLRRAETFPMQFPGNEQDLYTAGCLVAFEPGVKARMRLLVGLSAQLSGPTLANWMASGYQHVSV